MDPISPFFFDVDAEDIAAFQAGAERILRSGTLVLGEDSAELEAGFAEFVGTRHAIAVNSGTSALEILLKIRKLAGRTVLVPTNTNFATVAAVLYAGGRVRFLDMDEATFAPTLAMVQAAVEGPEGREIAGVLWVHIGGVVSPEFPAVVDYCRRAGIFALEDAAHAHGSKLGGVMAGNLADGAAFSFFATKVMTTCEGGMITTNDAEVDFLARSFRNQGKRGAKFGGLHHDFGNSHRITEFAALLGRIQLAKLAAMVERRQRSYARIASRLDDAGIGYVATAHMDQASHYKLIVRLPQGLDPGRVKAAMAAEGVLPGGGVYEIPCHLQPVFAAIGQPAKLPVAEHWCPRHICPPLTSGMDDAAADRVGAVVARVLAAPAGDDAAPAATTEPVRSAVAGTASSGPAGR